MTPVMTEAAASQQLGVKFIEAGLFTPEQQEKAKAMILSAIRERDQYDENDTIAAAQFMDTFLASQAEGSNPFLVLLDGGPHDDPKDPQDPPPPPPGKQLPPGGVPAKTSGVESYLAGQLQPEQEKFLSTDFEASYEEDMQRSRLTTITQVIVANPPADTYLKGVQVIPTVKSLSKLDEFKRDLVPGDENLANFEKVAAAVRAGTLMDVYYNKDARRVLGHTIKTPLDVSKGEDTMTTKTLDRKGLTAELIHNLALRIPTPLEGIGIGAEVVDIVTKKDAAQGNMGTQDVSVRLKFNGVSSVLEANNPEVVIEANEVKVTGTVKQVQPRAVPIDTSFQIRTGKMSIKNKEILRTVRLRGVYAEHPHFVRKKQFETIFPEGAGINKKTEAWGTSEKEIEELRRRVLNIHRTAVEGKLTDVSALGLAELATKAKALVVDEAENQFDE